MTRIKTAQVGTVREQLRVQQGERCALCKLPCTADKAVLDHDHTTGAIRATLHRGCNALLGKVENNAARYGVHNLGAFCAGVAGYLSTHTTNMTGLFHPTHKSADEKRVARNAKARKLRASIKKAP